MFHALSCMLCVQPPITYTPNPQREEQRHPFTGQETEVYRSYTTPWAGAALGLSSGQACCMRKQAFKRIMNLASEGS